MRASNRIVRIDDIKEVCHLSGSAFEASTEFEIVSNGVHYSLIYTGTKPFILYSRSVSYTGDGFTAYVFRDPVVENITGGTTLSAADFQNSNDFIPQDSVITITTDVTVPDGSEGIPTRRPERVFGNDSNQGNGGALELIGNPLMVRPNRYLLLAFVSRDASSQEIGAHIAWLEPDNIPGLKFVDEEWTYRGIHL